MLKFRLAHKIFFSFFIVSLLMVGIMIFILKYYVSENFSNYVSKIELEGFNTISKTLESHYNSNHNWDEFKNNQTNWKQLIRRFSGHSIAELPSQPKASKRHRQEMPPLMHQGSGRGMGQGGPSRGMGIGRRLTLFDDNKKSIIEPANGISIKDYLLRPLKVDNIIIGWLGFKKIQQLTNPLDINFLKNQTQILYFTGIGILILATLFSSILSKHILHPIKHLTTGTKKIASRHFNSRITINTTDEFNDLATQFNQMAQTLESFEELRKQWFSDISHELGTPLSILKGEIEALQDGVRQPSQSNLDSLHFEVNHINKIVNDLRELSLAETGAMSLNKSLINPIDILQQCVLSFSDKFTEENIQIYNNLKQNSNILVNADDQRLLQVFHNLLENNLKYSNRPGAVTISSKIEQTNLELYIQDSGPGVPDESITFLFDRLYRVDSSRNRKSGGAGLGLSICKYIIENHQGDISATNYQKGLQIMISLPVANQT